jgi:hypothetical protein
MWVSLPARHHFSTLICCTCELNPRSACFWFSYFSELCLYTTLCYQILCRLGLNGTDPLRGTTDMTLFLQAARYNRVNNIRL